MERILIVDDSLAHREYLATLLGYAGHAVLEAATGTEALDLMRVHRPALVITDVLMPTMDGFTLVRRLRDDPTLANTQVIFYSAAYDEREARALAQACGVEHFLPKSAEPPVIYAAVAAALGRPASRGVTPPDTFERDHAQLLSDKLSANVRELEAANRRLEALVEVGRRLASERDAHALLRICCDAARAIVGAQYAAIAIPEDGGAPGRFLASGMDDAAAAPLAAPPAGSLQARLMGEARPLRLAAIADPPQALGLPPGHPPIRALLGVQVASPARRYGWLYLADRLEADAFSAEDEQILSMLAAQVAVAYENNQRFAALERHAAALEQEVVERARVEAALRESDERLKLLSQQLVRAQEDERRRLAHELHDEIGQSLTATQLNLQMLLRLDDPGELVLRLEDSLALIEWTLNRVRALSLDLRPSMLDDLGLAPALRWLLHRQAERAGIEAHFVADVPEARFGAELETACFRIAQESITNALRHAQARRVEVGLRCQQGGAAPAGELWLEIRDDGVGFDVEAARARATRGASLGLIGMQERALLAGGEATVASAPGQGTVVQARFPLPEELGRAAQKSRARRRR